MVRCPICESDFDAENVNGVTVAVCTECDGVWLAPGDLDKLTQKQLEGDLPDRMSEPTECRYCQTPLGFGATCVRCGHAPTIDCPHGHGQMRSALVDIGPREFEIDRCETCGAIWVDGHEHAHLEEVDVDLASKALPPIDYRRPSASAPGEISLLRILPDLDGRIGGDANFAPQPHMWGKSEPTLLVGWIIFGLVAVFLVYKFVAPALVF